MKNLRYFTFPCLIAAIMSLPLPFITRLGDSEIIYGYEYLLVNIAVGIIIIVALLSLFRRSRNSSLLGLIFSLANLFFTPFLLVAITVFNTGSTLNPVELNIGAYVLIVLAPILAILAAIDTFKTYNKTVN